jgi:cell division protein FtsB
MVLRPKLRKAALLLAFYAVSGAIVGYFFTHAHQGDRGLAAKAAYKQRIRELDGDIAQLRLQRADLERRVNLMKAESLEWDLLDERSRIILNAAHRNDVTIILDAAQ